MRSLIVAVVLAVVVSLIGIGAVQVAGDIGPDGGVLPAVLQLAGDIGPDGG